MHVLLLATTALTFAAQPAVAQDATWLATPGSNDFNTATNWSPGTVPTGTAFFSASTVTNLTVGTATVGGWTFNSGASSYSFANGGILTFNGAGITINGGSATIANNSFLSFDNTSTAGNAAITNNSGGILRFNDASTAGSSIITNNMNLHFNNTSTAGSASITNNSNLHFNDASTAGDATIANNGGTLSFAGTSTAADARITNNGGVQFSDNTTAANAVITNNGGLTFLNSSNASNAAITNNGSVYFSDSSTAGSATITNNTGGAVSFSQTSTAGSATITNNAGGTLNFSDTSTAGGATITNNMDLNFFNASTAGGAAIANGSTGFMVFYDTSNAGSATITNSTGAVVFYDNSSAGSAAITNNSGVLSFQLASTAGNSVITNNRSMSFRDTSTAGNAAITNNGILRFRETSNGGNAAITNNASGIVDFSFSTGPGGARRLTAGSIAGAGTYNLGANELTVGSNNLSTEVSGVISGAGGSLVKTGTGTLTLSGINSYTGGTTINGGTIAVASDTGLGAVAGPLAFGGGTLRFNAAFDLAATRAVTLNAGGGSIDTNGFSAGITQNISGAGGLTKTGMGTLTLSGINTYTGGTTVNDGTLVVNGSIASSAATVNSGGTLGGTGTLGSTTIASGGTLAPGNSIGTLSVNGNLAFGSGSFYRVEVSATSADRTNVTGIATLTGATVQVLPLMSSFRAQTYTILNATGGISGTFAGLTAPGSFSLTRNPRLTYDANNVFLVLDPATLALPAGANRNQTSVAGGINQGVASGGTPPAAFDALLNMTGAQLNSSLTQASGEIGANMGPASFYAMNQFLNALLEPSDSRSGTAGRSQTSGTANQPLGFAPLTTGAVARAHAAVMPQEMSLSLYPNRLATRWSTWATGYRGANTTTGNASIGSHDSTSRIFGTAMGADYRLSPDTRIGIALGIGSVNFSTSGGLGSGRANLYQAGIHARHTFGPAYVAVGAAYGWQDATTERTVTIAGIDVLEGKFQPQTFAVRGETGYRFATPWLGITPYIAGQATNFHSPAYTERAISGGGAFALSYVAQTKTNVRTELGVRLDKSFVLAEGQFTLRSRLAWAHDTDSHSSATAAFQSIPGSTFTVRGARGGANSVLVTAGAEMKWRNGFSFGGSFEGEFSGRSQGYAGKGTLRYLW